MPRRPSIPGTRGISDAARRMQTRAPRMIRRGPTSATLSQTLQHAIPRQCLGIATGHAGRCLRGRACVFRPDVSLLFSIPVAPGPGFPGLFHAPLGAASRLPEMVRPGSGACPRGAVRGSGPRWSARSAPRDIEFYGKFNLISCLLGPRPGRHAASGAVRRRGTRLGVAYRAARAPEAEGETARGVLPLPPPGARGTARRGSSAPCCALPRAVLSSSLESGGGIQSPWGPRDPHSFDSRRWLVDNSGASLGEIPASGNPVHGVPGVHPSSPDSTETMALKCRSRSLCAGIPWSSQDVSGRFPSAAFGGVPGLKKSSPWGPWLLSLQTPRWTSRQMSRHKLRRGNADPCQPRPAQNRLTAVCAPVAPPQPQTQTRRQGGCLRSGPSGSLWDAKGLEPASHGSPINGHPGEACGIDDRILATTSTIRDRVLGAVRTLLCQTTDRPSTSPAIGRHT